MSILRKNHLIIAKSVAQAIDKEADYMKAKGFSKQFLCDLIQKALDELGGHPLPPMSACSMAVLGGLALLRIQPLCLLATVKRNSLILSALLIPSAGKSPNLDLVTVGRSTIQTLRLKAFAGGPAKALAAKFQKNSFVHTPDMIVTNKNIGNSSEKQKYLI